VKTTVTARHFELTDRLRAQIERKLHRLDRIAHPEAVANVELIAHASHAADGSHVAEVSVVNNGSILRSSSSGPTALAALDTVLDKLERQAVRTKERPRSVRKQAATATREIGPPDALGGGVVADEAGRSVVKLKRFDMEPMFEEDAITRMEELGHAFFVFLNAETDAVAVLYRRRDGDYGVIEPVLERRSKGR
jgi:putative sigma-54 modulation protein